MHEGQCNEKYEQKIHNARAWESFSLAKMSQKTNEFISFSTMLFSLFQLVFIFFNLSTENLHSPFLPSKIPVGSSAFLSS